MKNKNLLLIVSLFFTSLIVLGQAPHKIDFQAMARDGSGNPLLMQTIGVRISIYEGGSSVYAERHTPQTDDYGLFSLQIGDGTPLSGNFNSIDWSLGNHSVKVEVDPNGGYVYVNMGTSQLTSAPYALYGEDDDADPDNELQTLSIVGSDLTISDGNTVTLPGGGGTSLWTQNGADIYYDAGYVAIGHDTPVDYLHISNPSGSANSRITSTQSYYTADASGNSGLWLQENGVDVAWLYWNPGSQAVFLYESGYQTMAWKNNNVGIGIINPLLKLHVTESGSVGVLGSDLGLLSNTAQTIAAPILGLTENNTSLLSIGVVGQANSSTSTYSTGVKGYGGLASSNSYGVYGYAQGDQSYSIAVYGSDYGSAVYNYAGYFSGDVHVSGTLSKTAGTFKIDHPQDPANKYLIHSFVESPDMMNIYNGNVVTDAQGYAVVELPDYFDALNIEFRYQLTVIGEFAQAIIKEEISANQFTIQTDKPNVKVSWQVTGIRNDAWAQENRIKVEVTKEGIEKGRYIHPELFGKSSDQGLTVGIPHEEHTQHTEAPIQEKTTDSSPIQE